MKTVKRLITVFILTAVFVVGGISMLSASAIPLAHSPSDEYLSSKYHAYLQSVERTGDERTDVVLVALSQLGYHEGNSDADMHGCNTEGERNFVEYNRIFGKLDNGEGNGTSYGYAWCCAFATWCARTAGVPTDTVRTEVSCLRLSNWFKSIERFHPYGEGYLPQTGDLVFFINPGAAYTTHVGIVLYRDDTTVYTVEGNTSSMCVAIRSYALSDSYIYGYAEPDYQENSSAAINFNMSRTGYLTGENYYLTRSLPVLSSYEDGNSELGTLTYGSIVTLLESENGYGKIEYGDTEGWIKLEGVYCTPAEKNIVYYDMGEDYAYPRIAYPKGDGGITVMDDPRLEGFVFKGWSTSEDRQDVQYHSGDVITQKGDVTLYAVWEPIPCKVSFYDGSTLLYEYSGYYGDVIAEPDVATIFSDTPHIFNYELTGWDTDGDGEKNIPSADELTLKGDWVCRAVREKVYVKYTVSYYGLDGAIIERAEHTYGEELTPPDVSAFRKDGMTYTFKSWDRELAQTVTEDLSYTAVFDSAPSVYTVIFLDAEGKVLQSRKYTHGEQIEAPALPEKEATAATVYSPVGWDKSIGAATDDMTVKPLYSSSVRYYTVTFKDNFGNILAEREYAYNSQIAVPDGITEKDGYTFKGWDKEFTGVTEETVYIAIFAVAEKESAAEQTTDAPEDKKGGCAASASFSALSATAAVAAMIGKKRKEKENKKDIR